MESLLAGLLDLTPGREAGLARQLTVKLRTLIAEGRIAPGQALPSSRRLALSLGVSRNTVTQAIEQLASEGYLTVSRNRRPKVALDVSLLTLARAGRGTLARIEQLRPSRWGRQLTTLSWPPPSRSGQPRPFQAGLGDDREFPHAVWGRCLRLAAGRVPRRASRAGNDPSLQGALLGHLAARRGLRARGDQILIVPSAQAGLNLIAQVMIDPGETAWIESPGYGGAHAALRLAGAKVIGIPLDAGGLLVPPDHQAPRLVFTTPSHQYPTGRLMPVARRLHLLSFARDVGAVVVEDDYDGDFHYEGRPVAALAGLDPEGTILYVGTFTKVMSADIRVGYVVVPQPLLETFQLAQRHLGLFVSAAMQLALTEFIASGGLQSHIHKMTRLYRARRDCMMAALAARAGSRLEVEVPVGGMHVLARCDAAMDDTALCERLASEGVVARPLSEMLHHATEERGLFLGFSAWNEGEIARGIDILARVVDAQAMPGA